MGSFILLLLGIIAPLPTDAFGNATDPLNRWVFMLAAAANDAEWAADVFGLSRARDARTIRAEELYVMRLATAYLYEALRLLFGPPHAVEDEVNTLLAHCPERAKVKMLRTVWLRWNKAMKTVRDVTFHYIPDTQGQVRRLWAAFEQVAIAQTTVSSDQHVRHLFVDAVYEQMLGSDAIGKRGYQISKVLDAARIVIQFVVSERVTEVLDGLGKEMHVQRRTEHRLRPRGRIGRRPRATG